MNKIANISDEFIGHYFFPIAMWLEHEHTHCNIDLPYMGTQWHLISILHCFTNYWFLNYSCYFKVSNQQHSYGLMVKVLDSEVYCFASQVRIPSMSLLNLRFVLCILPLILQLRIAIFNVTVNVYQILDNNQVKRRCK